MTNTTTDQEVTVSTTTAPAVRFAAERVDGDWTVVRIDESGRQGVGTFPSREAARADARRRTAEQAAPAPEQDDVPEVGEGGPVTTFTDPQAPEPVDPAPAPVVKAAKHQRTSLARVKVADQLMTNLHTDGNGKVWVQAHRTSDGQVRKVAEVTTRKAADGEMPGTLYTLVFEDGVCSEERYGTTSHYLADVFDPAPASPAPAPAPAKPAKKAAGPAPKVPTEGSRAGKLVKGSCLVLREVGVVTVDGVSKTGGGKLEVAYTTASGEAGVREMWSSTNVRVAADA